MEAMETPGGEPHSVLSEYTAVAEDRRVGINLRL